jgi:hypothetical protein
MVRLAFAHFAEGGANALLGLAGLQLFATPLLFQALQGCQKPGGFRLGK